MRSCSWTHSLSRFGRRFSHKATRSRCKFWSPSRLLDSAMMGKRLCSSAEMSKRKDCCRSVEVAPQLRGVSQISPASHALFWLLRKLYYLKLYSTREHLVASSSQPHDATATRKDQHRRQQQRVAKHHYNRVEHTVVPCDFHGNMETVIHALLARDPQLRGVR